MEIQRRLESIDVRYYFRYWDDNNEIRYSPALVLSYRNIIDGKAEDSIDQIIINKGDDISKHDEKIQQIYQIAFENS